MGQFLYFRIYCPISNFNCPSLVMIYRMPANLFVKCLKILLIVCLPVVLNWPTLLFAQSYDPLSPPNTYRQSDNPQYWKNRKPFEGYWQQDVHYTIKADIDEKTNIISGEETLVYWNNSPDTLTYVYFHLYQNAFQPDSYYDNLQRNNDVKPRYGPYEFQKLGTEVHDITAGGKKLLTTLDNTILKVILAGPLLPDASITFDIKFSTYFGSGNVRRRMKLFEAFGFKHYDGVHWYPRISVYDRKFGWTTDQHLGREFYGDFGTYDVELTFANNFVVGATGKLLNRQEVLPDTLRKKLDITNFKDKPWNSKPSIVIPYDSAVRKTWKYHAENVHDFAFTADPTYRIGEATWEPNDGSGPVTCIALAQEPHAAKWQNAADYSRKIIETFSRDFGRYVYHKMIVADARDGMEYPMLTLDGGKDPTYRGLLAHEIGHNWFYGQVGNNETYRAALDEGFTTFLTSWALEAIDGEFVPRDKQPNKYLEKYKKPLRVRDRNAYNRYLSEAIRHEDPPLNTHSDNFNGALRHGGGYRQVYYKTAAMLYNLQYVLGDDLFLRAMQHYFDRWKFCHPYFADFRQAIIDYTKVDLNWFFDQWLETNKNIDYRVGAIKAGHKPDEYKITFIRKGRMQMPIDFRVISKDGKSHDFMIPNTWFEKKTHATVLPKWAGWDKLFPSYEAVVMIPGGIDDVIIDPSQRLADIHMLDNTKRSRATLSFDSQIDNVPSWKNYEYKWRPDVWYNGFDGLKAGIHVNGHFMKRKHVFQSTIWYNTGVGQGGVDQIDYGPLAGAYDPVSFNLKYHTAADKFLKDSKFGIRARILDGLAAFRIGIQKKLPNKDDLYFHFKSMYRHDPEGINYLLYRELWDTEQYNNSFNIGYKHHYKYYTGSGKIHIHLRSSSLLSDYDYARLSVGVRNRTNIGRLQLSTRTFAQLGSGIFPKESALYMAGANPEALTENKYTRAAGIIPEAWLGNSFATINADPTQNITYHFQQGGGLNLRGYTGYFIIEPSTDTLTYVLNSSNSGAAVNVELDLDGLVNFAPKGLRDYFHLDVYLFGDAGSLGYSNTRYDYLFTDIRMDAGLGAALTIKKFGMLETVKPLTLRFDMPFFLSHVPFHETDNLQFRWVVGINRAF